MRKITKREIIAFVLGLFTFLIIDTALNWEEAKAAIRKGYERGYNDMKPIKNN
ncbi:MULTISPECIES: hypothetical protein [unclassified Algoriphagus]|jgi:uncharacterized membrane protein YidH (DUF202 family)|uniref:hypothetical protein n=1 Tax=unclassified Algoriphagus TaxID=2641541 RepID=UPI002580F395|nr:MULTISPECIES: hypothetical protein [unclassified Algoriphagus]|tara:strand:- start:6333 stop:6491 length:159 start_codon:yes stop_codon:yes gene_type:complete